MNIIVSVKAEKQLKKLLTVNQIIIAKKIRSICDIVNNKNQNLKQLKGYKNTYRLRVGVMKIIFKNNSSEIYIILIGHRKDIYKIFKG